MDHPLWLAKLNTRRNSRTLLNNRSFSFWLLSDGLGMLGAYFYQVALPGLVFAISGSAAATGTAILIAGLARVVLMLPGGMLSDAFSPRATALAANALRAALLLFFVGLAASGRSSLPWIYSLSIFTGVCDALLWPARGAILARSVQRADLHDANVLSAGQEKIMALVAPVLAGAITTLAAQPAWIGAAGLHFPGVSVAFLLNFLLACASLAALQRVKLSVRLAAGGSSPTKLGQSMSLRELFHLIRRQPGLRSSFLAVLLANALSSGPLYIGLPVLASARFSGSAGVLGILMSAAGCGALLGSLLPGLLHRRSVWAARSIRPLSMLLLAGSLAVLFVARTPATAGLAALLISACTGITNVIGVARVQRDTPPAHLGRMMALLNLK